MVKGVLDVFLTLPLVLPPTVVGYLLLRVLGPKRVVGAWVLEMFGIKLTMTWWSAIFATTVVIFPLMYRTARGHLRLLTKHWPIPSSLWGSAIPIFSGVSEFPAAVREFWRELCWHLPGRWENMVQPVCSADILPGELLRFPRRFISCGVPMTMQPPSGG